MSELSQTSPYWCTAFPLHPPVRPLSESTEQRQMYKYLRNAEIQTQSPEQYWNFRHRLPSTEIL